MIFNTKVSDEEYSKTLNSLKENEIKIQLIKKIDDELKVFDYQEAWANFWSDATQKQKDCILNIKQFDKNIFKGITGIDIEDDLVALEAIKMLESKGYKIRKTN